jgi:SAM-dependent methyltransferase
MVERLVERGVLSHSIYTAVDADSDNIAELNRRVGARQNLVVQAHAIDVFDFIAREQGCQTWDVLIAHAFLDLLDLARALPQLLPVLTHGGIFYATIVFDGATIFEPTIDASFDAEIERLYHQTMDERIMDGKAAGDSHAGRHLFQLFAQTGVEIIEAGSSDWVVYPTTRGYRDDQAYFMHFIIDTLRGALGNHPALANKRKLFSEWIALRHRQIEENQLVYIAHQLDFVGAKACCIPVKTDL